MKKPEQAMQSAPTCLLDSRKLREEAATAIIATIRLRLPRQLQHKAAQQMLVHRLVLNPQHWNKGIVCIYLLICFSLLCYVLALS